MHADDFRTDKHGVVSGLRDGGYSDDMTLAAISGKHFLYCACYFLNDIPWQNDPMILLQFHL